MNDTKRITREFHGIDGAAVTTDTDTQPEVKSVRTPPRTDSGRYSYVAGSDKGRFS